MVGLLLLLAPAYADPASAPPAGTPAPDDAAAPPRPARSFVGLGGEPGTYVAIEGGGYVYAPEAHPVGGVGVGHRYRWGGMWSVTALFGPPTDIAGGPATMERDQLRFAAGYRYASLMVGMERAEAVNSGIVRGELLFPVAGVEAELPVRVGPITLTPFSIVDVALVDLELERDGHTLVPRPWSVGLGLRVEIPLGGPR